MNLISFEKFKNLQNGNHLKLSVNFYEFFFIFNLFKEIVILENF